MSDLVDECGQDLAFCGYEIHKLDKFDANYCKLFVDSVSKARKLGFDKGHYFIINAPKLSLLMKEHYQLLFDQLKAKIRFLLKENNVKKSDKVLFVGIGNPQIIADCLGPFVVEKVEIRPFKKSNHILKIIPNTFSNTGINAYDMIRLIVEAFDVDAVFLIDSLATKNILRLGNSIQFNDAGLTPGSAMNNFGLAINKQTLNVPCFSIGVPMMINAKDFCSDVKLDLILAEKDVKEKVAFLSTIIADVINSLFSS